MAVGVDVVGHRSTVSRYLGGVLPVAVAVVAIAALIVLDLVWRRRRAAKVRAARADELRAELTDRRTNDRRTGTAAVDTVPTDDSPIADDEPTVEDTAVAAPAAIHMSVTGTHPWAPARVFLAELKAEGYETTVELPDLLVMRDQDRQPVTVREPAGPPGRLVITATPPRLASALEILVRSLIESEFTLDATSGRDVVLTDDHGATVELTVTQHAHV